MTHVVVVTSVHGSTCRACCGGDTYRVASAAAVRSICYGDGYVVAAGVSAQSSGSGKQHVPLS